MASIRSRVFISAVAAVGLTAAGLGAAGASPSVTTPQGSSYPAWFSNPLTAAQQHAEVAIPTALAEGGPMKRTTAMYATQSAALAVPVTQAIARTMIAGEALVFDGALFDSGSAVPTAAAHTEVTKLTSALHYVTAVTCQGHTSYSSARQPASAQPLSLARAKAICALLHQAKPGIVTTSIGYGDSHPTLIGGAFAQRTGNRRTVVEITGATVGLPSPPAIVDDYSGNKEGGVLVEAGDSDGLTIAGYQYTLNNGKTWQPLPSHRVKGVGVSGLITGLTNGDTYDVEVRYVDPAGYSAPSNTVILTPTGATVPSAPVITSGSWIYGSDQDYLVTLDFTPSTSDGGSQITGYQYSQGGAAYQPLSYTTVGSTDTATFDSGIDTCDYDGNESYTIEAVNTVGDSDASNTYTIDLDYGC